MSAMNDPAGTVNNARETEELGQVAFSRGAPVSGPVHERGMYNIEAFDGQRWRGGMNRATREDAIKVAKVWADDSGSRYRVSSPDGQMVFDTKAALITVLRRVDDDLQRSMHYAISHELREAMSDLVDLIEDHKALYKHFVNTLESGRDRIIQLGGDCDPVDVMERSDPVLARSRELIARVGGAK